MNLPGVMLAVEGTPEDMNRTDVIAETKWDGTRLLCLKNGDNVRLIVARGKHREYTHRYLALVDEARGLRARSCILDGEFVFLTKNEHDFFLPISATVDTARGKIYRYMVFDIIMLNGVDLRKKGMKLKDRQSLLRNIIPSWLKLIRANPVITKNFPAFFQDQVRHSREGIMLKEINSPYRSERSKEWLKIKYKRTIDVIVKGGTKGSGARSPYFGAVHCYAPYKGKIVHVGDVGTGFSNEELKRITPMVRSSRAFVIEVKFYEFSEHHHMRFPVFIRLRPDKSASEVMRG
jgi:bifunctional non-homologous end joining protein LigD